MTRLLLLASDNGKGKLKPWFYNLKSADHDLRIFKSRVYSKNALYLFTSAHTAAFKLGGLFDILALFSIRRVNL